MNPFTPTGRYNIKMFIFENKRTIMVVLGVAAAIMAMAAYLIWSEDDFSSAKPSRYFNIPEPVYGNGPFGYGRYAPPENMLAQSLMS